MKEIILKHPLIEHKLSILRDKKTGTKEFRELINEITIFLCYEAMKNAKLYQKTIETPITESEVQFINENDYAFIPILRAGLGMIEGVIKMIPNAKIGHIGLYRDEESLNPVKYYYKVPKAIKEKEVFLLDPMLATGGSASSAIQMLKDDGIKKIKFLCIIAAPEGIEKVKNDHPDVTIYCSKIDNKLNDVGYITPGLGDAGDRIFGTK